MANLRGWITHLRKPEDFEALVLVRFSWSVACIRYLSFDDAFVEVFRMSDCGYVRLLVGRFSAAAETNLGLSAPTSLAVLATCWSSGWSVSKKQTRFRSTVCPAGGIEDERSTVYKLQFKFLIGPSVTSCAVTFVNPPCLKCSSQIFSLTTCFYCLETNNKRKLLFFPCKIEAPGGILVFV